MIKFLKIILVLIFLLFTFQTFAVASPTLIVNDSYKKCTTYTPSRMKELLPEWHYTDTWVSWEDFDTYCNSLGYIRISNEIVSTKSVEAIFRDVLFKVFLASIFLFIYIYYRLLHYINIKNIYKIAITSLCVLITSIILSQIFMTLPDMLDAHLYQMHSSFFEILLKNINDLIKYTF